MDFLKFYSRYVIIASVLVLLPWLSAKCIAEWRKPDGEQSVFLSIAGMFIVPLTCAVYTGMFVSWATWAFS